MLASFMVALIVLFSTLLAFALIGWLIGARKPSSAPIRGAGRGYYDSGYQAPVGGGKPVVPTTGSGVVGAKPPSPARFAKGEAVDLSHRGRGKEASKWSEESKEASKSGGRA